MKTDAVRTASFRCCRLFASFSLSVIGWLAQVITAHAQFSYTINNGAATITGSVDFSDSGWTNHTSRFYRISFP